jgi:hypothetical protein
VLELGALSCFSNKNTKDYRRKPLSGVSKKNQLQSKKPTPKNISFESGTIKNRLQKY